jgi:hypothetical protein
MGNPQYIQDAVDGFEILYGEELTGQQRANLVEACEYGEVSLGVDADLATDALMAWGDYTGDMESALDNVEDLKTLLLNFDGEVDDLDEYLTDKYLEEIGITDETLGSYVALFTDFEKYQRHLEYEGWRFAPLLDGTTFFVFSA